MLDLKASTGEELFGFRLEDGQVIPFRLLSFREFKSITSSLKYNFFSQLAIWDWVFDHCVADPVFTDRESMQAGLTQSLAQLIIHLSGPGSEEFLLEVLEESRKRSSTIELQLKSTICRIFPGYTMDKLDEITFPVLVQLFAQAERVMLDSHMIEKPFEIKFGNKEEKPKSVIKTSEIEDLKAALRD